ncbi:hypothetical protein SMD44_01007 [Streptomyces alboflavus]|uniref:Uncharacterized protein n=1 Tax=Streptomyces alboflavus TaxID=67267 RepID=A0A1Z1W5G4_9ACTN|nr:hypothetical protein [Streptomyces alboflavus]ARX81609.1 hypothetical protein SMD44_01007 [Streptomyces alboflavus]
MVSSAGRDPNVPKLKTMRDYMEALNELRDMVPAESRNRMYDLLTAIVEYTSDDARVKTLREAGEGLLADLERQGGDASGQYAVGMKRADLLLRRKADTIEGGAA